MFIFHDNSGRDNDNDAVGKCDKSRWQSGWKENKEGGRPTNDEDVDKEVDEKDNRNNEYFDYFDFQLLLGWVWVAREQILRRARWFLLLTMRRTMFFSIIFSICYPN